MTKKKTTIKSITGRDGYIVAQALAYASEMLKYLGLPHDQPSNRSDMDAILDAMGGGELHRAEARAKLRRDLECYVQREGGSLTFKYPTPPADAEAEYAMPGTAEAGPHSGSKKPV